MTPVPRLKLVTSHPEPEERQEHGDGVLAGLLRFPLFYKILVANAVIIGLVALGCALLARSAATNASGNFVLVVAGGLVLSVASNAAILWLALMPLRRLEEAARQVREGDLQARVEPSPLADRELARLADTFNMMLDSADIYRQRLREVAARALNAQEEERKRIARELHDGIAQTLAGVRMRLRVARTADREARSAGLERIGAEIGEATEELRRIAQGLRPPALDMLGLVPAIESYARTVTDTSGIEVHTDMAIPVGRVGSDAELALYRIVQEALSNIARHSGATSAHITLDVRDGWVVAEITDDGRGFDVAAEMDGGGLGLFGMQERGAYVGGSVQIESEPGRGTRVRVMIPTVETARYA